MDEFSGIRAKTGPKRETCRGSRAAVVLTLAGALLAPLPAAASGGGGHDAPPPAAEAPPPPPPPPPPPKRTPEPPPKLDGPIAAPAPRARMVWLTDRFTGRAIGGFDPVAYRLDGTPHLGDPDHQLDWSGATWLFVDEGTLAAFRDAPLAYAPAFGGHCAFGVASGRPAEGSPIHFVVHRDRLLLFADAAARTAFLLDPDRLLDEADRRWATMVGELP